MLCEFQTFFFFTIIIGASIVCLHLVCVSVYVCVLTKKGKKNVCSML